MQNSYRFDHQLAMSRGVSENADVGEILLHNIPGAISVSETNNRDDRSGVDWWVKMKSGDQLGVDCKIRYGPDYQTKGKDDLALESWSVVEKKVGWTRNSLKRTDYVLWFWKTSGRWCLVPFPMLCKTFEDNWQKWRECYETKQQHTAGDNGGYFSECTFVPRAVIWRAIYDQYGGNKHLIKVDLDAAWSEMLQALPPSMSSILAKGRLRSITNDCAEICYPPDEKLAMKIIGRPRNVAARDVMRQCLSKVARREICLRFEIEPPVLA